MLLSLLIILLVTGATVILARMKYPGIALAWAVYLVMSLPTALFFLTGIQPLADRYTYLSMMSIMVLVGAGAMLVARRVSGPLPRMLLVAAVAAVALGLGTMTYRQAETWKSSLTLWSHAVRVAPSSAVAFNNLGQAHLEAGAVEEAMLAFTVASRLKPDYADVYNNMGVASIMTGDARGGRRLLEQARIILEGVPSSGPDLPDVYRNLGRVHYELGDLDSALASYRRCLALQPQDGLAWNGLAEVLEAMGYGEESLRATERAASLGNPDAQRRRAQARGGKGAKREDPP
jgi:tetratricopeptide (TPR) repeat protein